MKPSSRVPAPVLTPLRLRLLLVSLLSVSFLCALDNTVVSTSLATIAAEHRLSTRYVQLLFEESGTTFRGHVRARRLEKCREALADPLNANVSITEICLHWGFGDSASFSRAFRDAYDCTPTAYRRAAIGRRGVGGRLRGVTLADA